jgi:hypothetical protein
MSTTEFQIEVKSNIKEWADFLRRLIEVHRSKPGSAWAGPSTWNLELRNEASTRSRTGEQFEYFKAVDKGRAAISRGYVLRFAAKSPDEIRTKGVGATHGYHITERAESKIHATIDSELQSSAAAWVKSANESVIGGKSSHFGAKSVESGRTIGDTTRIVVSATESTLSDVGKLSISAGEPIETPIDGKKSSAVIRELLEESKKTFDVDKILAEITSDPDVLSQAKNNPGIRRLIKLPQWPASKAIFGNLVVAQVEKFKVVTPSRAETGSFKLVYADGGQTEILDPKTGGSLRNGYRLITSKSL